MVALNNESPLVKWILLRVPLAVHRLIKAKAARKGVPLRDYVAKVLADHSRK